MTEDPDATVRATERWLDEPRAAVVRRAASRPPSAGGCPVPTSCASRLVALVAAVVVGRRRRLVARDTSAGSRLGRDRLRRAGRRSGRSGRSTVPRSSAGPRDVRCARWACCSRWRRARCRMLLLFITFLFINTEVWQVASTLRGGVLWQAVLLFAVHRRRRSCVARLPEELEEYDAELTAERVVAACRRTPVESAAAELEITEEMLRAALRRGRPRARQPGARAADRAGDPGAAAVGRGLGVLPGVRDRRDQRRGHRATGSASAPHYCRRVRPGQSRARSRSRRSSRRSPASTSRSTPSPTRNYRKQFFTADPPGARAGRQRAPASTAPCSSAPSEPIESPRDLVTLLRAGLRRRR